MFLTWRLFGSLPSFCIPESSVPDAGKAFARADLLLDVASDGPLWLKDPRIAAIVADALEQGESEYRLYERFAWVIMPNHVHVVMRPWRPLPAVMRWIKGSTARSANLLLQRTGKPFWQYESYDHVIRNSDELNRAIRYIERNPVRAGLAVTIENWPLVQCQSRQKARPKAYSTCLTRHPKCACLSHANTSVASPTALREANCTGT